VKKGGGGRRREAGEIEEVYTENVEVKESETERANGEN